MILQKRDGDDLVLESTSRIADSEPVEALRIDGETGAVSVNESPVVTQASMATTYPAYPVCRMFHFENVAAKAADDVHVALRGDLAPVNPTAVDAVTITSPVVPRNLRVTMGANWDGGDVIVYGTDQFDVLINETFAAGTTVLRVGSKAFKTVTKITKTLVGTDVGVANTASVGSGDALGIAAHLSGTYGSGHLIGTGFDSPTLNTTYNTVTFATAPDGAKDWNLFTNINA